MKGFYDGLSSLNLYWIFIFLPHLTTNMLPQHIAKVIAKTLELRILER